MPFCGLAQKSRGEFSPRLFSHTQQTARRRSPHRTAPANAPTEGTPICKARGRGKTPFGRHSFARPPIRLPVKRPPHKREINRASFHLPFDGRAKCFPQHRFHFYFIRSASGCQHPNAEYKNQPNFRAAGALRASVQAGRRRCGSNRRSAGRDNTARSALRAPGFLPPARGRAAPGRGCCRGPL